MRMHLSCSCRSRCPRTSTCLSKRAISPSSSLATGPFSKGSTEGGDNALIWHFTRLIRWTASDSDLPFAFYRAYHRQLATYLVPFNARADAAGLAPVSPAAVVTAPGFLFLAASLLDKSDSLVHRNLRSVTSIGPTSGSFNTNDSANLSFGQKPKVLELAHRRIVQTMVDIAGGPPSPPPGDADVAPDAGARRYVFSGMLQVWIRACVKRTSMWDVRSVFLVLDLVEGLLWALAYTTAARVSQDDETPVPKPDDRGLRLFDIPFLFDVVRIVFTKADNTVSILRVVSFCYSLWDRYVPALRSTETRSI